MCRDRYELQLHKHWESIPEAWPEGSENEGAPDATFTTTGAVTGSFDDAETGSVSTVAEITCEGSDCVELGEERGRPTPCTGTVGLI